MQQLQRLSGFFENSIVALYEFLSANLSVFVQSFLLIIFMIGCLQVVRKAHKRYKINETSILATSYQPIRYLIITFFLGMILDIIAYQYFSLRLADWIGNARNIILASISTVLIIRIIKNFETKLIAGERAASHDVFQAIAGGDIELDKTTASLISKILMSSAIVIAGIFILRTIGASVEGLLAFGGFSGVAVGFAGKDLVAGVFSTIILYIEKQFALGDTIRIYIDRPVPVEGVVEKITWRFTQIRSRDKKAMYIPNAQIVSMPLENCSDISQKRLVFVLTIFSNTDPNLISQVQLELNKLAEMQYAVADENVDVVLAQMNESIVILKIQVLLDRSAAQQKPLVNLAKCKIFEGIYKICKRYDLRFDIKVED